MKYLHSSSRSILLLAAWATTLLLAPGAIAAEKAAPLVKDLAELKQVDAPARIE